MNIIKFVSVALWSMCMLFLSCKKENPSLNETPATVEIFVCNSKGEPLENKTVGLYDENRYKDFQKDHTVKPLAEVITCLLYTSPSPRDRQKSRMPSSA